MEKHWPIRVTGLELKDTVLMIEGKAFLKNDTVVVNCSMSETLMQSPVFGTK